jgi:hypothetical protein
MYGGRSAELMLFLASPTIRERLRNAVTLLFLRKTNNFLLTRREVPASF